MNIRRGLKIEIEKDSDKRSYANHTVTFRARLDEVTNFNFKSHFFFLQIISFLKFNIQIYPKASKLERKLSRKLAVIIYEILISYDIVLRFKVELNSPKRYFKRKTLSKPLTIWDYQRTSSRSGLDIWNVKFIGLKFTRVVQHEQPNNSPQRIP